MTGDIFICYPTYILQEIIASTPIIKNAIDIFSASVSDFCPLNPIPKVALMRVIFTIVCFCEPQVMSYVKIISLVYSPESFLYSSYLSSGYIPCKMPWFWFHCRLYWILQSLGKMPSFGKKFNNYLSSYLNTICHMILSVVLKVLIHKILTTMRLTFSTSDFAGVFLVANFHFGSSGMHIGELFETNKRRSFVGRIFCLYFSSLFLVIFSGSVIFESIDNLTLRVAY